MQRLLGSSKIRLMSGTAEFSNSLTLYAKGKLGSKSMIIHLTPNVNPLHFKIVGDKAKFDTGHCVISKITHANNPSKHEKECQLIHTRTVVRIGDTGMKYGFLSQEEALKE